jgi:hypothetical protein
VPLGLAFVLAVGTSHSQQDSNKDNPAPRASIRPTLVRLAPEATQPFKVTLSATRLTAATVPRSVAWSVNDIPGGNAEVGTIDESGLYRAPAQAPVPREVSIRAAVSGASNRYVWATVVIGNQAPAYKLTGSWSEPDSGVGRLRKPHGISIDNSGNLLIADQKGGHVWRYTVRGELLGEIGSGPGSDAGQFTEPRYAVTGPQGNIYVTDLKAAGPRLQVFSPEGRFVHMFGKKGPAPGEVLRGHGLAFDTAGRLYAPDVDNFRVSVFGSDGKFLTSFGREGYGPGDFNAPHGLYIDPSDDVFVNGYYGPTQKFTREGRFLISFAAGDPPDGPVYFHSMSGDRFGNVYVVVRDKSGPASRRGDTRRISVLKYNNSGDYICSISMSSGRRVETWVAIAQDGTVYSLFTSAHESGVEIFREE